MQVTDYDFRNLSPIDFEALVRDILSAEFGVPFETFAVGPDGGIDIRHVSSNRTIIVQCKHRPAATKAQIVASAAAELAKWADEIPTEYYFVTSANLSPDAGTAVTDALGPLAPHTGHVWARGRLNGALSAHSDVERRHFKLWLNSAEVLDRILRSGEWERSEALIHQIRDRIRLYVNTPEYDQAFDVLHDERVVLISGQPGVGKSTLAEMLLLTHWHAGWRVVNIVSDIGEAWQHVRDPDQKTVFYYDDFLGQTSSLELQKNEGNDLALFIRTLQRSSSGNALLVMTSREQILNAAVTGPDDRIRRAIEGQRRLRVEMDALSRHDRARILFNHLYFSYEENSLLDELSRDTRYRSVVDHRGFNPRVLESVVLVEKPETADALYDALQEALDHPDLIWKSSFDQLSTLGLRILLHLAIEPSRSLPVAAVEQLAVSDDPRGFTNSLRVLEGSWIRVDQTAKGTELRLYDPSRRDFLLDQLGSGPVFKLALVDAATLQQIEHLLGYRVRRSIWTLIERMASDIDDIAAARFSAGLDLATANENRRASATRQTSESFRERTALLTSAAAVLAFLPAAERLSEALIPALGFLDENFTYMRRPAASALFRLATALDELDPEWANERAEQCVLIGVENIDETEEIREYAGLPDSLGARAGGLHVDRALDQAFGAQLDGIEQQSDRDLMASWLSEIEDLARELGVTIYTDSLRERIDEMPEPVAADYSAVQRVSESVSEDDSNTGLEQLFARLAFPVALG